MLIYRWYDFGDPKIVKKLFPPSCRFALVVRFAPLFPTNISLHANDPTVGLRSSTTLVPNKWTVSLRSNICRNETDGTGKWPERWDRERPRDVYFLCKNLIESRVSRARQNERRRCRGVSGLLQNTSGTRNCGEPLPGTGARRRNVFSIMLYPTLSTIALPLNPVLVRRTLVTSRGRVGETNTDAAPLPLPRAASGSFVVGFYRWISIALHSFEPLWPPCACVLACVCVHEVRQKQQ